MLEWNRETTQRNYRIHNGSRSLSVMFEEKIESPHRPTRSHSNESNEIDRLSSLAASNSTRNCSANEDLSRTEDWEDRRLVVVVDEKRSEARVELSYNDVDERVERLVTRHRYGFDWQWKYRSKDDDNDDDRMFSLSFSSSSSPMFLFLRCKSLWTDERRSCRWFDAEWRGRSDREWLNVVRIDVEERPIHAKGSNRNVSLDVEQQRWLTSSTSLWTLLASVVLADSPERDEGEEIVHHAKQLKVKCRCQCLFYLAKVNKCSFNEHQPDKSARIERFLSFNHFHFANVLVREKSNQGWQTLERKNIDELCFKRAKQANGEEDKAKIPSNNRSPRRAALHYLQSSTAKPSRPFSLFNWSHGRDEDAHTHTHTNNQLGSISLSLE